MNKIATAIFLLYNGLTYSQEDYRKVLIAESQLSTIYLNVESIKDSKINTTYFEFWLKEEFKETKTIKQKIYNNAYSLSKYAVDCNAEKLIPLLVIFYDEAGKAIDSIEYNFYDKPIQIVPSTVSEKIFTWSCKFYRAIKKD